MSPVPSSLLNNLLLTYTLLAVPLSAQLFVYPPPSSCTQCTVPYNLGLAECETPYLSECYCQSFTLSGEEIGGMYISPIIGCARSNCTASEVDELTEYYSELCSPPASIQQETGTEAVEISTLLSTTPSESSTPSSSGSSRLSESCSTCMTTFTTNTFNQCTLSDLSTCLCSSDTLDSDIDQFAIDCPCSAPAQRAALLDNGAKLVAPPAMQLLACLRGPSCSGGDKALLARWGEGRCERALFTWEKMYRGEWEEEEIKTGRLKVQRVGKRDRMGSMSSWGGDDGFEDVPAEVGRGFRVQRGMVGLTAMGAGLWLGEIL